MIITLQKVSVEETCLKVIKAIYNKPIVNMILIHEKLRAFALRSGTRHGGPLSPVLFNIVLEVLATTNREEKKKNERNPDWKRRSKTITVCR